MACQITRNDNGVISINAPNGSPSILFEQIKSLEEITSDEQALRSWLKIYTKTFKEWFGIDWENISTEDLGRLHANGILDNNGEPSIFYRGDFKGVESYNHSDSVGRFGENIYLVNNLNQAKEFATQTGKKVYPVFMKAGKVVKFKSVKAFNEAASEYSSVGAYIESIHSEDKTIIGPGVIGNEYNVPSSEHVKSIFTEGFSLDQGLFTRIKPDKFVTEEFQQSRKSDQFVQELIDKLAKNLGMDATQVQSITEDDAAIITRAAQNPWSGQPAFFHEGKVYFVEGQLTYETAIHEFAHPLVRAIRHDNPGLINKIFEDLTNLPEGMGMLSEALTEYPNFSASDAIVQEEVIVKAITAASDTTVLDKNLQPSSKLKALIDKILYALKQIFRKIKGKTDFKNLNPNTTVKDLSNMLMNESFNTSFDTINEGDIVAYMHSIQEHTNDLMKAFNDEKGRGLVHATILTHVDLSIKQMRELREEGNIEELKIILADETGRMDQEQMLKNIRSFDTKEKVYRAYDNTIDELEEFKKKVEALSFNLTIMDSSVTRMKKHMTNLVDSPNQKEALGQISVYVKTMDQYAVYLNKFKKTAEKLNLTTESPLVKDILSILENIQRGKDDVQNIYKNATRDTFYEMFTPLVNNVTKATNAEIARLQKKIEKGGHKKTLENLIQIQKDRLKAIPTKETMLDYVSGNMGDSGFMGSWFESFISNQDPSIASFGMFIKKHMSEVQVETQAGYNQFVGELGPLFKDLGVDPSKLNKFADTFTFLDKSFRRTEEGKVEEYEVHTFLNEFKDYKFNKAKLKEAVDEADIAFEENPNEENTQAFVDAVAKMESHTKLFFNKKYNDEFQHANDKLNATALGRKAKQMTEAKISEISSYQRSHQDEYELYEDFETVDVLWREYKQLFSLYDDLGQKKTGEDLEVAKMLQEHRENTRDFYKYELIEGAFETSLKQFRSKHTLKMVDEGLAEGTPEFEEELEKRTQTWIDRNVQVKVKDSFYVQRNKINERISEIMSSVESDVNFDTEWETILDSLQGRRDNNGQPIATELTPEHLESIKKIEVEMEKAKKDITGLSGLTPNESAIMSYYYDKIHDKVTLAPDELKEFNELKAKKGKLGLSPALKEELHALFNMLSSMQEKKATDYYIDKVNEFYNDVDKRGGRRPMDFDHSNIDYFLDPAFVDNILAEDPEFKAWFKANHLTKTKWDKTVGRNVTSYQRSYAWSVVKPTSKEHYESTKIFNEKGELEREVNGVPNIKYSKREVKDEYRTGYNPVTKKVELEVGVHQDAKGGWLPKSLAQMEEIRKNYAQELTEQEGAWDQYINRDYIKLKTENPKLHQALEGIKKFHLDHQKDLEPNARLGLEMPRYRKDSYQYLTAKGGVKNKFSQAFEGIRENFAKRKDDHEDGLNFDEQMMMTEVDLYSGESGKVPITGKYMIETDQVSRDITSGIMNYYQSSRQNKKLREIQPIANAFRELAHENNDKALQGLTKGVFRRGMLSRNPEQANRTKVIDGMVEIFFEGKALKGASNNALMVKGMGTALGMASHSFFAFDVTSAVKNFLGAQFQIALEGAGRKYFNYSDWQLGRPWAQKTMWEVSGQIHSQQVKSKNVQMINIFDALQGNFNEKFGETLSRSIQRDATKVGKLTTLHRKWLESEASLQLFSAIMHSTKVEQTINGETKKIRYINAWEKNPTTGQIQLKEGIDKTWDVNGDKFNETKFKNHEVSNHLQGAYAKMDQPLVNRYLGWKMVGSMRKYFTKMALHRYGAKGSIHNMQERTSLGTADMHMGFYIRNIKTIRKAIETTGRSMMYMNHEEKRAAKLGILELLKIKLLTLSYMFIWGFDEDDDDKWKKRRGEMETGAFFEGSGAMPWLGLTDEEWSENFNLKGWIGNQTLMLQMQLEAESVHFIPMPGYGLKDLTGLMDQTSVSSGPSIGAIKTLAYDLSDMAFGDESALYKKDVGALNSQQAGEYKFWKHAQKMIGLKGKWIDPVTSMKNFKSQRDKN